NFGDSINPWFWSHYIDRPFEEDSDELFVGIGTLLNNRLPANYSAIHVMGSGAGYGEYIPSCPKNWRVHCVRGPLTADSIGIDRKYAIADPAILLNELVPLSNCKAFTCSFMPHVGI
ncbi:hypothetical protein JZU68_05380, partial [bacterium]|nr:hypothetical protein [bacterium]